MITVKEKCSACATEIQTTYNWSCWQRIMNWFFKKQEPVLCASCSFEKLTRS